MINLKTNKITILSCIPGRLRICVKFLYDNEIYRNTLCDNLLLNEGIISSKLNNRTGNILIIYKENSINQNDILDFIHNFKPQKQLAKKNLTYYDYLNYKSKDNFLKIYKDEFKLSKNLLKFGFVINAILYITSFNINKFISILILTFPAILFLINYIVHLFIIKKWNKYKVVFNKSFYLISKFSKCTNLIISEDILMNSFNLNSTLTPSHLEQNSKPYLIENHITKNIKDFIYDIRSMGIKNIIILSKEDNVSLNYIANSLGINKIFTLSHFHNDYEYLKNNLNNTLFVLSENYIDIPLKINNTNLTIGIYDDFSTLKNIFHINMKYKNINKIPLIYKDSKLLKDYVYTVQSIIITIIFLGILGILLNYISVLSASFIYVINVILSIFIVKFLLNLNKTPIQFTK